MNNGMDKVVSDPRQISIIRQTCLKCAVEIADNVEDVIKTAKELYHFVLHGEQKIEIPDLDLDKFMKKEDK